MSELRRIACADPRADYIANRGTIDAAIARVLENGRYILADEAISFEGEFSHWIGASHCVGLASGTDAIHLALRALEIGDRAAVITAAHTAVATVAAIELAGATPVLCDIDPKTFALDLAHVARTLDEVPNVAAIVPVHLYGHPADMTGLMELARQFQLKVIEDCAQAIGAEWAGQKTGTFGDIAAFSFYPTKNLSACGDAGAVVTSDGRIAQRVRELQIYGWRERYISERRGLNSRLDEIQAAILRAKLPALDRTNARRREIARRYRDGIIHPDVALPGERSGAHHVYHQFTVRTAQRDGLKDALAARAIDAAVLYPLPVHEQPAYRHLARDGFPQAERACRELLCLPVHQWLSDDDVDRVIDAVNRWSAR